MRGFQFLNVVYFVEEMFCIVEEIEVENVEYMVEFLYCDINGIERDCWEGLGFFFIIFVVILFIIQVRSGVGVYFNEVVVVGYFFIISLYLFVIKVLFKKGGYGKKYQVFGVEYMVGEGLYLVDQCYDFFQVGELCFVWVRKEVIVFGGLFNMFQIFMFSGIGFCEELEVLGILVVVDFFVVVSNLNNGDKMSNFDVVNFLGI